MQIIKLPQLKSLNYGQNLSRKNQKVTNQVRLYQLSLLNFNDLGFNLYHFFLQAVIYILFFLDYILSGVYNILGGIFIIGADHALFGSLISHVSIQLLFLSNHTTLILQFLH